MIDIEERSLRAFEQDTLPLRSQVTKYLGDVSRNRRDHLGRFQRRIKRFIEIDCCGPKIVLQQKVVVIEDFTELRRKVFANEEIRHAQRAARHLVLVRRTDTAPRSADGGLALGFLARKIERRVRRQDQRAARADTLPLENRHAISDQRIGLGDQGIER